MTSARRTLMWIGVSLLSLIVLASVAIVLVVQTQWFRDFVRSKIVSYTEEATGGTATVGGFQFDWTSMHAVVTDFILHGTEGPDQPPLFRAKRIDLYLRLFPSLSHAYELESLGVNTPQVNVIVYPDGHTNVPSPKVKPTSNTTVLEDVVNLAIRRFDIQNGLLQFGERRNNFSAKGENLITQLSFDTAAQTYDGHISIDPLYLRYAGYAPLDVRVAVPIHLERDKVQVNQAKLSTAESEILINGSLQHLTDPQESAHINARVSLPEVKHIVGSTLPLDLRRSDVPKELTADLAFSMDKNHIQISTARLSLGDSNFEASGALKDPSGKGSAQFNAKLALDQIGRMLDLAAQPSGVVDIGGNAKLAGDNNYSVVGKIAANNVSFRAEGMKLRDVNLSSRIDANQNAIRLEDIKLAALGGGFTGNASLTDMRQIELTGNLHNFDLQQLARTFARQTVGYDGIVSGPIEARDDLKAEGTRALAAQVHLVITPGRKGIPVSGRLNALYNGATGVVDLGNSFIALPSSRLDVSGALNSRIQVRLVSRNLNDFLPALQMASKSPPKEMPVVLERGGSVSFSGTVAGQLSNPRISGHLAANRFQVEDRPFDSLVADLNASRSAATVQNAVLTHGSLHAQLAVTVGLHNWSPESRDPLTASARIENAGLADLLAFAGEKNPPFSGTVNASAQINGTVGNPRGAASLSIVNGTAHGYHFDQVGANVNFADRLVNVPDAHILAGTARLQASGTFQHPSDSFTTGHIEVNVASNQMPLDQFRAVSADVPQLGGSAAVNATASADLGKDNHGQTEFRLTKLDANIAGRSIHYEGENLGDVTAVAHTTTANLINYAVNAAPFGSSITVNGQTRLVENYPTTATLNMSRLPVNRVVALVGRKDLPLAGNLNVDGSLSGTLADPNANLNFSLANGTLYEHIDSLQGRIIYTAQQVQIPSLQVTSGSARAEFAGSFTHPRNDFKTGHVQFTANTNSVQLAQLKTIQEWRPGLAGSVQIRATGTGNLQDVPGQLPVLLTNLDANVSANGIRIGNEAFGDASLTADTRGQDLDITLRSDFANSRIDGNGRMRLAGDYPVTAQINFANVTYAGLRPFLPQSNSNPLTQPQVDGSAEGSISVTGPALKPDELIASLRIPRVEVTATARGDLSTNTSKVTLHNEGPIVATLSKSVIRIESAHIVGPETDVNISGNATLQPTQALNVTVAASANLSLLQSFDRNVYSSGNINLNITVRGTLADPNVNGQLRLQNAALNVIDAPNGLSNANGVIVFNGKTATIQSLTGESGGGKVSASGNASYANGLATFRLAATAATVRVRYPEGLSTVADASVTLNGTSEGSTLAGTITIDRIEFNPHSDFGSILTSAAPPIQAAPSPNSILASINLQIQVRTAPSIQFQTALAQNVEATADLRVGGTLDEPSVLGRVDITQGQLVFFGTKYTVNQGSIGFYNPLSIVPVLDIDLETNVQGVDITLTVSGPIDDLQLTHRSDPPLPFDQVLALLAAGKTPTDPTIAARQPAPPPQSVEQMGESAILGQAVANPLANRLSRVFGISQLQIAPAFVTGSVLPQARLTITEQVSRNIDFTYITDVTNSNTQIFQIEWAISDQYSAVATRDENGLFGIDFYYKRKFK